MGLTATIGTKGQIVIPAEIRHQFGLEPGQRVGVVAEGDRITLTPIPVDLIEYLTGCLKDGPSLTAELVREHAEELRRDAERGL